MADDEELIRQTIHDVLTSIGVRGGTGGVACDGISAQQKVAEERYDLVISDIKMPRRDGLRRVRRPLAAADPAAKVILITAFGYDPNHSSSGPSGGVAAVLMKPFKVRQLVDTSVAALGFRFARPG